MTTAEVKYIIEDLLGEPTGIIAPLKSIKYITITKKENKFGGIERSRFLVDLTNGILKCYNCKEYNDDIPNNWVKGKNYDQYEVDGVKKTFKYLFDSETMEPIFDQYSFDSIIGIKIDKKVRIYDI